MQSVLILKDAIMRVTIAVNVASRMMSTGLEGHIQCSSSTVEAMRNSMGGSVGTLEDWLLAQVVRL